MKDWQFYYFAAQAWLAISLFCFRDAPYPAIRRAVGVAALLLFCSFIVIAQVRHG